MTNITLDDIIWSKKNAQNGKYLHIQALVDSAAILVQKIFDDCNQASEYHALAVESFYSQSSLDWLYSVSCSNNVAVQIQLKSLTDRLNRSELQYYYALVEVEKKNYTIACDYMTLAALQSNQNAYSWLKNLASKGDKYAQLQMIGLFDVNKIESKDEKIIFDYCYEAIKNTNNQNVFKLVSSWAEERKNTIAQSLLATCYAFGYGTMNGEISYSKAYALFERASDNNDHALYNYAVMRYLGFGISKKNIQSAINIFENNKSKDNFGKAYNFLVSFFFVIKVPNLLDFDQKKASFDIIYSKVIIALFIAFILMTSILFALSNPSMQYWIGRGLAPTSPSIFWYNRSATQGNKKAMLVLAVLHAQKDNRQDASVAMSWYKKATGTSDLEAMLYLANLYEDNFKIRQETKWLELSNKWYEKAAKQGSAEEKFGLGQLDFDFQDSKEKGNQWYLKAARQGNAEAQYQLGFAYLNGSGVKQSNEKSIYWISKAAKQGHAYALEDLKNVNKLIAQQNEEIREN